MLSYELRVDKQMNDDCSSTNVVTRGCGAPWPQRSMPNSGHGHGRARVTGRGSPLTPSRGGYSNRNSNDARRPASTDSTDN
jgi:hypothetical protein